MAMAYGTNIYQILGTPNAPYDQGTDFGAGLSQAEIDYLVEYEWARTAEDILMRRSKLGYYADKKMKTALEAYLSSHALLS